MKIEDLNISSHTGIDPCGRVFFYQERVLRAISPQAEQLVREFLTSELYGKLVDNGWCVKMWVINDIQVEGYPLIIESEKVQVCSWQLLTFTQLKDCCILALKIQSLCDIYGWSFHDDGWHNYGVKEGRCMYFDIGGFCKKDKTNIQFRPQIHAHVNWKKLRLMSDGLFAIARLRVGSEYNDRLMPNYQSPALMFTSRICQPIIKSYQVFRKMSKPAIFVIRFRISLMLLLQLNKFVRIIAHKPQTWNFFTIIPTYKKMKEDDYNAIVPYYTEDKDIKYQSFDVKNLLNQYNSYLDIVNSIMLYGEFYIDDIIFIRKHFQGTMWICSPCLPYTDLIFKEIRDQRMDIGVIAYDFHNLEADGAKIAELGIDALISHIDRLRDLSMIDEPNSYLWQLSRYFETVYLLSNNMCDRYVRKQRTFIVE